MLPKDKPPKFRVGNRMVEDLSENSGLVKPGRNTIGCSCGTVLIILLLTFGIGVFLASNLVGGMNLNQMWNVVGNALGFPIPETIPVAGDPANFDPVQELTTARLLAGEDSLLIEWEASYVRSDGTMDLTATYNPSPRAQYTFLRVVPPPDDAPPLGVAGRVDGLWYETLEVEAYRPGQSSHVTERSGNVTRQYTYVNDGMLMRVSEPSSYAEVEVLPPPGCSLASLWESAIAENFPAEAVAIIEYSSEGYRFRISGVGSLDFDLDCRLIP